MGSSSKRAPARSPHALGGASTLGNQPLAQQYQQHQPYQPYKPYQPCQQDTEQPQPQQQQEESKERGGIYSWQAQVKEEDPYDGYADYDSRCSQNPVSFGLQETPRSYSGEYLSQQSTAGSSSTSTGQTHDHHSSGVRHESSRRNRRRVSSPTVNNYTYCGRHSNEWLFGGHGFSDIGRIFKKSDRAKKNE